MIETARFTNFKCLHDVAVDLQPFTLLVGGNGSGKSSILQGLHDLLQVVSARPRGTATGGRPAAVFAGAHHPVRLARKDSGNSFEIECLGSGFDAYGIRAYTAPDAKYRFLVWRGVDQQRRELGYQGRNHGGPTQAEEDHFFGPLKSAGVGAVVYLRIDAKTAAEPHYSDEEEARVEFDGYGLPSVLQRLQLQRDGRFEAIEAALTRIVPSVRRLRAVPHKVRRPERMRVSVDGSENWVEQVRERTGTRIEAEVLGGGWIPADLLSEGTVLTLTLLTVLNDRVPKTMLLDDLDQALHPAAQARLVAELRSIMASYPTLQIIATTHSPFLVDHAAVEEVRVVRLDDGGGTRCRPLAEHPRWEKRAGFLLPGEFWSGVGEDWIGS